MIPYLNKGQGNIIVEEVKDLESKSELVYCSESMQKLLKVARRVASTDASILIFGKSGTGKELIAKAIHNKSYRNKRPFIVINCSCLNQNTVESELFGHEKGAFTGATKQKIGLLEKANTGTLVLDEIGDLKPKIQSKLLRLLQESEIYRVGGTIPLKLNIRVICSTSKNLTEAVLKGRFREDLYYRINTISMTVPSLSERPEDIPMLLKHFLGQNIKMEKAVVKNLINYPWAGNVRELKNLCERLRIIQDGQVIKVSHLPEEFVVKKVKSTIPYNPQISLEELNKTYIINALEHFPSKRQTAKALGITVKTLYNRLHEYGLFEHYAMHPSVRPPIPVRRTATVRPTTKET